MVFCRSGNRDYGACLKNAVLLVVPVYKINFEWCFPMCDHIC